MSGDELFYWLMGIVYPILGYMLFKAESSFKRATSNMEKDNEQN